MPITDLLRRNAREFGEDTALVEILSLIHISRPSRGRIVSMI